MVFIQTVFATEGGIDSYLYVHNKELLVYLNGSTEKVSVNDLFKKMQVDRRICKKNNIPYIVDQTIEIKGEDNA